MFLESMFCASDDLYVDKVAWLPTVLHIIIGTHDVQVHNVELPLKKMDQVKHYFLYTELTLDTKGQFINNNLQ